MNQNSVCTIAYSWHHQHRAEGLHCLRIPSIVSKSSKVQLLALLQVAIKSPIQPILQLQTQLKKQLQSTTWIRSILFNHACTAQCQADIHVHDITATPTTTKLETLITHSPPSKNDRE
jgi:hypothetical protein